MVDGFCISKVLCRRRRINTWLIFLSKTDILRYNYSINIYPIAILSFYIFKDVVR